MWKVAQASVTGRGHVISNNPCQDKTFYVYKNGVCVIALADGAGSARCSHFGAERAVQCISNILADQFYSFYEQSDPSVVRHELLSRVVEELELVSKDIGCALQELASTLLSVAVCGDKYLIVHLGDGVIGYHDNGILKVASSPNNGEFCNSTVFTTSSAAEESIRLLKGTLRDGMKGFVLFSDGVESILYKHSKNEISQSLYPVFDDLAQLDPSEVEKDLLETLEEIKGHTSDDCSIIVMSRIPDEKDASCDIRCIYDCDASESRRNKYLPAIIIGAAILCLSVIAVLFAFGFGFGRRM